MAVGVAAFGCPHREAGESLRKPRSESLQKSHAVATAADKAATVDYLEGTHAAEALAMIRKAAGEPFRTLEIEVNPTYVTADRKSTRLNSSHLVISYAVFCL